MKGRLVVLSLFAAFCAVGYAQAVVPFITVHGTEIKLGVAADSVISTFQRSYTVRADGKTPAHSWYVSTGKNPMPFAILYVRSNSIVGVEYLVTERETTDIQGVFAGLYAAVSKLSNEGRNACSVSNSTDYVPPDLSKSAIFLSCGVYQLRVQRNELQTTDGKTLFDYMVWESLGNTE